MYSFDSLRTIIYADNQATINIIEQNKISNRSRHFYIPVTFSHEKFDLKNFQLRHIDTNFNIADSSTKVLSGPILSLHIVISLVIFKIKSS